MEFLSTWLGIASPLVSLILTFVLAAVFLETLVHGLHQHVG